MHSIIFSHDVDEDLLCLVRDEHGKLLTRSIWCRVDYLVYSFPWLPPANINTSDDHDEFFFR
jgi:hypothetical protein